MTETADVEFSQITDVVNNCREALKGHNQGVQCSALCELMSLFLACHAPILRPRVKEQMDRTILAMVRVSEQELFGGPHPAADLTEEDIEHGNVDDHART